MYASTLAIIICNYVNLFLHSIRAAPRCPATPSNFFPFRSLSVLPRGDDVYRARTVRQPIKMYGRSYRTVYVSINYLCLASHLALLTSSALQRSPTMVTSLWIAILVVTPQDLSHTDQSGPSLPHTGLMWTRGVVLDVCTMERQHLPLSVQEPLV